MTDKSNSSQIQVIFQEQLHGNALPRHTLPPLPSTRTPWPGCFCRCPAVFTKAWELQPCHWWHSLLHTSATPSRFSLAPSLSSGGRPPRQSKQLWSISSPDTRNLKYFQVWLLAFPSTVSGSIKLSVILALLCFADLWFGYKYMEGWKGKIGERPKVVV